MGWGFKKINIMNKIYATICNDYLLGMVEWMSIGGIIKLINPPVSEIIGFYWQVV